jgi:surfeit locus 1 family protein
MLRMALRPRWIAVLLVALAFAAGFVLLSQWQISRSVSQATIVERDTEVVKALTTVAEPQSGVTTEAAGRLVRVQASLVPGDFSVLSGRANLGEVGYWLVGHAVTDDGTSLAVALGWAATQDQAWDAVADAETKGTLEGRYLATEPPGDDDFQAGERTAVAVATLINEWQSQPTAVYGGYLVLSDASSGLEDIDAPAPSTEVVLNWLNIFYAVEWVVFAGFAIFLWWRFVRDAVEREEQERAELN